MSLYSPYPDLYSDPSVQVQEPPNSLPHTFLQWLKFPCHLSYLLQKWVVLRLDSGFHPGGNNKWCINYLLLHNKLPPKLSGLKQKSFIISSSLWVRNQACLAGWLWQRALKVLVRAVVSCEGLAWGGSYFKLTYMFVSRIQLISGCWTEGLFSLLDICWCLPCYLPCAPLHRAPQNMACGLPQSDQVSEGDKPRWKPWYLCNPVSQVTPITFAIFYSLEASH